MSLLLKGHIPIGTPLLLMEQPDSTIFYKIPQIEEDVAHLPHLCCMYLLVILYPCINARFHLCSRTTHKKHLEQINAEIPLKWNYLVIHYLHNAANIAILFILALIDVLPAHDSGLASFFSHSLSLGCMTVNGFTYLSTNTNVMLLPLISI